ncbi:gamma-butyrobetaine dioxygenase [Sarotherodon galilaeus]
MFCPFCGVGFSLFTPFCASCGRSLELLRDQAEGSDILQYCIKYFNEGHSYSVIMDMMLSLHGVKMSLRSLKSKLNNAGLYRRKHFHSRTTIINAIRAELQGPGRLFGYRTMWQVLKQKHHLKVKRDDVMKILRELNPHGCQMRTRRRFIRRTYHSLGPNYMWHADGYDKLKPFGLAISGCIDGFSRKVLWLECGPTNNNPVVIAYYYLSCVGSLGVVPMRLRTDCGTENGIMAAVQCALRHHHDDHFSGESSHMFGSSTNNQRIESWWSIYRKGSHEHQCLLRFCFTDIVQKDLDECVKLWNTHRIRPSRTASCPGGVPNELYYLPHRLSVVVCGDSNIQEYLNFVMAQNHFQKPVCWESATELYMKLLEIAHF